MPMSGIGVCELEVPAYVRDKKRKQKSRRRGTRGTGTRRICDREIDEKGY